MYRASIYRLLAKMKELEGLDTVRVADKTVAAAGSLGAGPGSNLKDDGVVLVTNEQFMEMRKTVKYEVDKISWEVEKLLMGFR